MASDRCRRAERPERIVTLDILRGLAVMGILLMNIGAFALPEGAYFNPHAVLVSGRADVALWIADYVLIDGKFRNIFSLLFGAGILLLLDRARAAGDDEGTLHMRRMTVLGLFGLAHHYLIWRGDILFHYAIVGTFMLFLVDRRPIVLVRLALAALIVHATIAAATLATIADMRTDPALWAMVAPQIGGVDPGAILADVARMQGRYGGIVHHRLVDSGDLPFVGLLLNGFETAGLMLIGMAAFRTGLLTGGRLQPRARRLALLGGAIGVAGMAVLANRVLAARFDPVVALGVTTLWSLPFRPLLAIAYVALTIGWIGDGRGVIRARIAAVGRAAFTNYLGSSIAMTTLFYGYGFGLYGRLDRLSLLGVVVIAWMAMLAWSKPWLDRHAHGPLEWLWRRAAIRRHG